MGAAVRSDVNRLRRVRTNTMQRAYIYVRVSTVEQTSNLSLETQRRLCTEYCERNGFVVDRIFNEEGESAKTADRTQLRAMLAALRENKGRIAFVVVYRLDRFARNVEDHIWLRAALKTYSVALRSVSEPVDDTSAGRLVENFFSSIAQFDNDVRSERTTEGMKARLRQGGWTFQAPLGYVLKGDGRQRRLEVDESRAPFIRRAFEQIATGTQRQRDVLQAVTAMGLLNKRGRSLTLQTFRSLLRNPIYCGVIVVKKWLIHVQGDFVPIVSGDMFARVQDVLSGRRPSITPHVRNHPDFPLRHFVRCGSCDRPLTGSWSTGRSGQKYPYYRCPNSKCGAVNQRAERVEELFAAFLREFEPRPQLMALVREAVIATWRRRTAEASADVARLQKKLAELESKEHDLVDAHVFRKTIDAATYGRALEKLRDDTALTRMALRDALSETIDVEGILRHAEQILTNAASVWIAAGPEQKQRIQKVFFSTGVVFDGERFGTAASGSLVSYLRAFEGGKTDLASPTGFEPVLSP